MGTNDEVLDNQEDTQGQVEENQGQPAPEANQPPVEVELEDGTKISLEELRSGYMKDADYRRKTQELADEKRRIQREREDYVRRPSPQDAIYGTGQPQEEPEPLDIIAKELLNLKATYARDLLSREIDRLYQQYPDADRRAVFTTCWSNPNANIEEEMKTSDTTIKSRVLERTKAPATLDEFFKANPKAKAEYDQRLQNEMLRKKSMKSEARTVTPSPQSSETVSQEKPKKMSSYREATERLRQRWSEEDKQSI